MDTPRHFQPHYDAVIVGARCAGAATAMLLARAGMNVLAIDRQAYGSDTMSTHALMRTGVLQLERWGLLQAVMAAGTPEIRATTFHYGCEQLHLSIKPEYGVKYLCAPRRTVLDRILVDAARSAGADVRHGVVLSSLQIDSKGRVVAALLKDADGNNTAVRSGIVIGADGRQSTVAALVKAETYLNGQSATGYVYGYYEDLERHGYHWHFAENVAAGVIPTNHGQHCVFVSVPGTAFPATFRGNVEGAFFQVLAANSPHLSDDVSRARLVGRLRGFGGAPGHLRQSHGPGWALVGDAGYFKDPLTAHGITDALRDAELLARAMDGRAGALEAYQHERDALSEPLFHDTEAIASFRWNLDEIKILHSSLSASVQAECKYMAGLPAPVRLEPQTRIRNVRSKRGTGVGGLLVP
jgi:2-polyprenyl-6-methoxyphenol hydroxylase-like FAD-dependent oxidoreductase